MLHRVFVYGTLRNKASNAQRMSSARYLFSATANGELYQVQWYPGIVLNGSTEVLGEVYEVDEKILSELDTYEGSEYRRVTSLVTDANDIKHEVWVYEYLEDTKNLQRIPSGNWLEIERGL